MRWEMGRYSCCDSKFQAWSSGSELAIRHNSSWFPIAKRKTPSLPCSEGVLVFLAIWARGRWPSLPFESLGEGDFFIHRLLFQGSFVDPPRPPVTVYEQLPQRCPVWKSPCLFPDGLVAVWPHPGVTALYLGNGLWSVLEQGTGWMSGVLLLCRLLLLQSWAPPGLPLGCRASGSPNGLISLLHTRVIGIVQPQHNSQDQHRCGHHPDDLPVLTQFGIHDL